MKTTFKTTLLAITLATIGANASAQLFGSTPDPYERRAEIERHRQEGYVNNAINNAPEWMFKLPVSNSAIYATGSGVSYDLSLADHKAKSDAYGKLCMIAGGVASQQTKIYKTDTDKASVDNAEMVMRTACKEVNLTGVEVKEVKRLAEGNRFRTFVLIVYPTGDANLLKASREIQKEKEVALSREDRAFKELDTQPVAESAVKTVRPDDSIAPTEQVVKPVPKSNTVGVIAPQGNGQITLMDVDNAEYKARRDVALQKPGAVIGQTIIQN
jgi:hypothetical protein